MQIKLEERHLRALWKRSNYPLVEGKLLVFGIRGCLPVNFLGTDFATQHDIRITDVDYRFMRCTIGLWRPGKGFALYPGSTVPYIDFVKNKVSKNGEGVNRLGLGRYTGYTAGWHKREDGAKNGHRAYVQTGAITIQRTGDDADYDLADRWQTGRLAGDNIHCARHMGPDGKIPDSKYSSLGCQVVAGTVVGGQPGSERGPWKSFVAATWGAAEEPSKAAEQVMEYVLWDGHEVANMVTTGFAGKSIILRFGSQGPLVENLQRLLQPFRPSLKVDGDFGPGTFDAIIDYQTAKFGPLSDDGIVGGSTAKELKLDLPPFDPSEFGLGAPAGEPHAGGGAEDSGEIHKPDSEEGEPGEPAAVSIFQSLGTLAFTKDAVGDGRFEYSFNDPIAKIKRLAGTTTRYPKLNPAYLGLARYFGHKAEEAPRYDPADWRAEFGGWADFIHPTAICESRASFTAINSWDSAAFTFGFFQFAAHTPDDNLVLLLRKLLALQPDAPAVFPDLTLVDGKVHQVLASGLTRALEGKQPRAQEKSNPEAQGALMDYFNPRKLQIDEAETMAAARLILWACHSADHRQVQVATAVEHAQRKLRQTHEWLQKNGGPAGGLKNIPIHEAALVMDIRHHGRAGLQSIRGALFQTNRFEALCALGGDNFKERKKQIREEVTNRLMVGEIGKLFYDPDDNSLGA